MQRIVLFSTLTEKNSSDILDAIFPEELAHKTLTFIPSSGIAGSEPYIEQWQKYADTYGADCNVVDNTKNDPRQREVLLSSNIVVISGGNTFTLLDNLRRSELDKAIKEFVTKNDFVLAGFSAGAIVLTPTIAICNLPKFDENVAGINDITSLSIVDFEIFPHYKNDGDAHLLEQYQQTTQHKVVEISDEDYLEINW